MESLMQLLLVLAFMYWMTPYLAPRRRPARPPERPRAIGRFASTPGPERREHRDDDGEGNGVGDLDGKDEDRPRLQPSLKGTHYSPSLRVVSDQSRERQETPVRASTSRAALPSGHVSRASVSSTASRRTVRWATESDEEDVKPLVNAREALASSVTSAEPCEMISVGSSTSSSKALQSSGTQTRSNLSTANAGSSSTRGAHSATRVASTSYVTPSASASSSLRSDTPDPSSFCLSLYSGDPDSLVLSNRSSDPGSLVLPYRSSDPDFLVLPYQPYDPGSLVLPYRSYDPSFLCLPCWTGHDRGDSLQRRILDIYDRQFVWFKNLANTMLDNGQPAGTGWFESESDSVIDSPPTFPPARTFALGTSSATVPRSYASCGCGSNQWTISFRTGRKCK
ncbi:hypothetical protein GSI_05486 [Ganoderma sinense ZZ0214-1]|uniref:Uncharacterized protein n=1 Tax=Ganoderma sinense ZZ0214-1 TaxID=1077348 RepID=A0A2G8SER3_9APHY|nr:hypothetical protein GSI_05486 [Ganoderma sinense ZZ0214-1]